ncbi:MAG TPA: galactokinase [Anaerolineales bacterium]|nr:galactokinase [Anaerolineales bacterium]
MNPRQTAIQAFQNRFSHEPMYVARAPGRVNLLGEHVDYNNGFVLPAAIDRATYVAFSPSPTDWTTLVAADFGEEAQFTALSLPAKTQPDGSPLPEWALYPAGTAWALAGAGHATPAMQAAFSSDIPRGSGLSSSASIEMAFGVAWSKLGGWSLPPMQLALLGQKAENRYVGVNCGIMDQFASACGEADRLMLLDCRSLEYRSLPLPAGTAIVVADTTVRRKLTSGEYNARRAACENAVRLLSSDLPGIQSLRDVSLEQFNRLSHKLPPLEQKRARHVVEEIERTYQVVPLLEQGRTKEFGQLMNACHASLRDLYEVSVPELDSMVAIAQPLPGCFGARLTGAGFGGCTVNLVASDQAGLFARALAPEYERRTGLHPEIYICQASQGAGVQET